MSMTDRQFERLVAQRALTQAISRAGGHSRLAKMIGVSQPAVAYWVRQGRVPPARVLTVEAVTGVSRHKLRPDIYPEDDAA